MVGVKGLVHLFPCISLGFLQVLILSLVCMTLKGLGPRILCTCLYVVAFCVPRPSPSNGNAGPK